MNYIVVKNIFFTLALHESCRQIDDGKWHGIKSNTRPLTIVDFRRFDAFKYEFIY